MSAKALALLLLSLLCQALPSTVPPSWAQTLTLEDLAALQRAAIENEARRSASRPEPLSAAAGPTVPAPAIAVIPSSTAAARAGSPALSRTLSAPPVPPGMAVAGIAGSQGHWMVELTTDAGPLTLQVGDLIPGTAWRIAGLSARAVRLERVTTARGARPPRKSQRLLEPGDAGPFDDE